MGGQRKGSLKDRSELEFSYRRKELLNLALFDTQLRSKNKVERNDAELNLCLRYFLLKKDHERRVNEIESRIEQSTCSAKRDFTTYFDDAERFNEQTCLSLFRFKMEEIDELVELLGLNEPDAEGEPFKFRTRNRTTFTGKEGLLLLLAYLNSGKPFITLLEEGFTFGASPAGSQLVDEVVRFLYNNWAGPLLLMPLKMWFRAKRGNESRAEYYRRCISGKIQEKKREVLETENLSPANAVEFESLCEQVKNTTFYVDGTDIEICRPEENQEAYYNGRKKSHVISYQGIVAPDGLVVRLGGAYEGRLHDARVYRDENFELEMEDMCKEFDGDENSEPDDDDDDDDNDAVASFTIYADSAYGMTKYTKRPHKRHRGGGIGIAKKKFNFLMSSCRINVENAFCLVKFFKWMGCKNGIRIGQAIQRPNDTKPAFDMKVYVSCFLTNLRTCLRWNQISASNQCTPPSIEEYLGMCDMYLNDE
jgi:hypothetical protein